MSNIDQALQFFRQAGYSPHAAAGIVGGLIQESGGGGQLNPLAVHDAGTGIGIAGWRDPVPGQGRKTNLMNFARRSGLDWRDINTQLRFLAHELDTSERGAGQGLRNARNVDEAASAFIGFERPQGWTAQNPRGGHGYQNRLNNAQRLLGQGPTVARANEVQNARSAVGGPTVENAAILSTAGPPMDQPPMQPPPMAPPAQQGNPLADMMASMAPAKPPAAAGPRIAESSAPMVPFIPTETNTRVQDPSMTSTSLQPLRGLLAPSLFGAPPDPRMKQPAKKPDEKVVR
jgi:hypothetical protein